MRHGLQTENFGFRKSPNSTSHRVRVGYSFKQESGRADYLGEFRRENRGSFFGLYAYTSGVDVLRFYGYGNDTTATAGTDAFYKVNANQVLLYPSFKVPFAGKGLLTLGPAFKYTQSDQDEDQFINEAQRHAPPFGSEWRDGPGFRRGG